MAYRLQELLYSGKRFKTKKNGAVYLNSMLYHCSEDPHQDILPSEWYGKAFLKITKLTHLLKDLDLINGRLVDIRNDSIISDDRIEHKMNTFKSLVRVFIGSPSMQQTLKKNILAFSSLEGLKCGSFAPFGEPREREPMLVDSLTKVSNFLNISAQQRKVVRLTLCPQVTEHRIWTSALEKVLNGLKFDLDSPVRCPSKGNKMGQQIIYGCLKFLNGNSNSCDIDSTSWMKLAPRKAVSSSDSGKWEDVLDMFTDLIECLRSETGLQLHVTKLEVMKEGLAQIKNVLLDNSIGYKEARHQENLVQKKLSKTLGHSSRCLFTLLLYYLYEITTDIEVDMRGGIYAIGGDNRFCLSMGRILTSSDDKMVLGGAKQLDRVLGIFKLVWETAEMKGLLELQGHLWCPWSRGQGA
ncbi:Exosome complex exonuclease [Quillaja saponaria]|uniref:Exosome complex exonuclease n=1 Tax=Quillaja saponaria TaxID=32244 RepID=A0AAD7L5E0_QUISA|nr:Exosome complex exonuclease [Quillaja saponaria]